MKTEQLTAKDILNLNFVCICDAIYKSRNKINQDCLLCNYSEEIIELMHTYGRQIGEQVKKDCAKNVVLDGNPFDISSIKIDLQSILLTEIKLP